MKNKLLIITSVAFALIIGFAVWTTWQLNQSQAKLASLSVQRDPLKRTIGQLESALQGVKADLAASDETSASGRAEASRANGATDRAADAPTASGNAGRRTMSATSIIADDPAKTAEYLKHTRAGVDLQFGAILRRIALSPAQIEAFKDAQVAFAQSALDRQAALDLQGLDYTTPEFQKLQAESNAARVKKSAEIMGDKISQYMDLYRSNALRGHVRLLAATGLVTGEPVTAAQVERAGDILAANCRRPSSDAYVGYALTWNLNWAAASEQLKSVLSPGQIEILRLQIDSRNREAEADRRRSALVAQFKKQQAKR